MGKLKFTLSNLWFWIAMVFMAFLTENLSLLTSNMKAGFNVATLAVLSIGCLACLVMYFLVNHKTNKVKLDFILLPAIAIVGLTMVISIWLQKGGTFNYANGEGSVDVTFTTYEKLRATIIFVLFLAFTYAFTFMMNINRKSNRIIMFLAYVGIATALISVAYSLATEMNVYVSIFKAEPLPDLSIDSFYGNKNYYGGILFIGIMSCIIAIYYRPRLHWYILICALYIVLISTAAVLPSLICTIAVPVYLFEEVVRFAIKKKWKYCIFALISVFILMSLAILFYWGSKHEWNGFIGLDVYITQTFKSKNFITYSGRTQIWNTVIPLCFDNPIHAIFGHGFMLSEKYILAITGAMNSDPTTAVRTTHNGYIETLFDYGIIGLVVEAVLLCYFIYACIRLLLEKRFHFVFIYAFVFLCCATYNFCESSSFFDAGVKEIYMTMLFVMPVFGEYKLSRRPEKIIEIKNLPATRKEMDPVKLGQSVALVIMSLLVVAGCSLVSTIVYQMPWFKNLMLNIVIGLGISLLFVPYLVTLYYKGKEKLHFILHTVFNGLLIPAVLVIMYLFMKRESSIATMIPYLLPGLLLLTLVIETVAYSLIKNGSIKEWAQVVVKGSFVINRYALVGGALCTLLPCLILQSFGLMNYFIYLTIIILGLIGYFMVFHFLPTKGGKEIIDYYNELAIWNIKRVALKDETYYG